MKGLVLAVVLSLAYSSGAQQAAANSSLYGAGDPALVQARSLIHTEHFAEAEQSLRQLLATKPELAPARYALAYCLLRENRPAESLKEYTAAAGLQQPSSEDLVNVGKAYVLIKDEPDADKWTLKAVQMDPKNAEGWYSLGRIRYTDQHFADAVQCFRRVLTLSPHNVKAENNLGLAFEGMNRRDDAVAAYRQAIAWQETDRLAEASEQPLINLAIILIHDSKLDEAQALLAKAVVLAPRDWHIHEQLGHLALQRSDFAGAQREFAEASRLEPKNSSLHFLLGQAYRHLGKQGEASAEFAKAAELARTSTSTP